MELQQSLQRETADRRRARTLVTDRDLAANEEARLAEAVEQQEQEDALHEEWLANSFSEAALDLVRKMDEGFRSAPLQTGGEVETTFTVDAPAQVCDTNGCCAKVCLNDVMRSTLLARQEDTQDLDKAQHCVIRDLALLRVDNTLPVAVDLRCSHGGVARGSHHEAKVTGQSSAHVAQPVLYKITPGQRGPPTADPAGTTVLRAPDHMTPAMFDRYRSALDGRLEDPRVAARSGGEIHYHSPEVYDDKAEGWHPDWFLAYLGSEHARMALGGKAPDAKVDLLTILDDGDDSAPGKHLTFTFKRSDFEQLAAAANRDVVQPMSMAAIPLQDSDLGFSFAPRGRHVAAPVKGTEERPGVANRDAWKATNSSLTDGSSGSRSLPGECSVVLRARMLYV